MEKLPKILDLSRQHEIGGIKISRRHMLRILATLGAGAVLAKIGNSRYQYKSETKISEAQGEESK